jgi:outer membrane lipoprotein-sorting protein
MEIWFDVETGIVMKSKMYDNKTIVYETNVTKVTVSPEFSKDTFSLNLPSGVQVVNIDELKKKEKKTD